jgi:hypothetical protein
MIIASDENFPSTIILTNLAVEFFRRILATYQMDVSRCKQRESIVNVFVRTAKFETRFESSLLYLSGH